MKNLTKILLSFLVIVNLYVSFDHIISQESISNEYKIELLLIQNQYKNESIHFHQLKQSFSLCESLVPYKKKPEFDFQINNHNLLEQLKFSTQEHAVLNFKPLLLQIVINEITIQKSHCI